MAYVNYTTKEIHCKILYLGIDSAGKSTTMQSLFQQTSSEINIGEELNITYQKSKSPYFEFLPIKLGTLNGFAIKLHIFSFAWNHPFHLMKINLYRGTDGLVYVIDSRIEKFEENLEAVYKIDEYLAAHKGHKEKVHKLFQYNKRDLDQIMPLENLQRHLNSTGEPSQCSIAEQNEGTFEGLFKLTKNLISHMRV